MNPLGWDHIELKLEDIKPNLKTHTNEADQCKGFEFVLLHTDSTGTWKEMFCMHSCTMCMCWSTQRHKTNTEKL